MDHPSHPDFWSGSLNKKDWKQEVTKKLRDAGHFSGDTSKEDPLEKIKSLKI